MPDRPYQVVAPPIGWRNRKSPLLERRLKPPLLLLNPILEKIPTTSHANDQLISDEIQRHQSPPIPAVS
jgi:hypothetical protein